MIKVSENSTKNYQDLSLNKEIIDEPPKSNNQSTKLNEYEIFDSEKENAENTTKEIKHDEQYNKNNTDGFDNQKDSSNKHAQISKTENSTESGSKQLNIKSYSKGTDTTKEIKAAAKTNAKLHAQDWRKEFGIFANIIRKFYNL